MTEWEMFKIKELADLLQLNQQTVRNMVNRGELEFVKIGRTKFIPREAAVKPAGGTGLEMPELLTVEQVAELLKLSKATLWNWINAGTFPAVRVGDRRFRIKRSDLDAYLDTTPTPRPIGSGVRRRADQRCLDSTDRRCRPADHRG